MGLQLATGLCGLCSTALSTVPALTPPPPGAGTSGCARGTAEPGGLGGDGSPGAWPDPEGPGG